MKRIPILQSLRARFRLPYSIRLKRALRRTLKPAEEPMRIARELSGLAKEDLDRFRSAAIAFIEVPGHWEVLTERGTKLTDSLDSILCAMIGLSSVDVVPLAKRLLPIAEGFSFDRLLALITATGRPEDWAFVKECLAAPRESAWDFLRTDVIGAMAIAIPMVRESNRALAEEWYETNASWIRSVVGGLENPAIRNLWLLDAERTRMLLPRMFVDPTVPAWERAEVTESMFRRGLPFDRSVVEGLVDETFRALESFEGDRRDVFGLQRFLGALLHAAARVAPERSEEFLERALRLEDADQILDAAAEAAIAGAGMIPSPNLREEEGIPEHVSTIFRRVAALERVDSVIRNDTAWNLADGDGPDQIQEAIAAAKEIGDSQYVAVLTKIAETLEPPEDEEDEESWSERFEEGIDDSRDYLDLEVPSAVRILRYMKLHRDTFIKYSAPAAKHAP